jgi:hypothetical protein
MFCSLFRFAAFLKKPYNASVIFFFFRWRRLASLPIYRDPLSNIPFRFDTVSREESYCSLFHIRNKEMIVVKTDIVPLFGHFR